ncbi:MAG: hypothetical protein HWD61_11950 [Parachlamydiaceae bacterium]|nr:MAG: hypothetical protein HWD61_11950 [Parachlamydiaceae bacterium]
MNKYNIFVISDFIFTIMASLNQTILWSNMLVFQSTYARIYSQDDKFYSSFRHSPHTAEIRIVFNGIQRGMTIDWTYEKTPSEYSCQYTSSIRACIPPLHNKKIDVINLDAALTANFHAPIDLSTERKKDFEKFKERTLFLFKLQGFE